MFTKKQTQQPHKFKIIHQTKLLIQQQINPNIFNTYFTNQQTKQKTLHKTFKQLYKFNKSTPIKKNKIHYTKSPNNYINSTNHPNKTTKTLHKKQTITSIQYKKHHNTTQKNTTAKQQKTLHKISKQLYKFNKPPKQKTVKIITQN